MKALWIFLLVGCSQSNEPVTNLYAYRSHTFYRSDRIGYLANATIETVTNGVFYNISDKEYSVFPRLRQFRNGVQTASYNGSLGFTLTDDYSATTPDNDRWQALSDFRATIKPYEVLKIKIFTGKFFTKDTLTFDVVFVINGVEHPPTNQVNW